ncbi:MAG: hypothetical protein AAFO94_18285, partial [Bacteroidota bacterium]
MKFIPQFLRLFLPLLLFGICRKATGQISRPVPLITCYHHDYDEPMAVPPPDFIFLQTDVPRSNFEFIYTDSVPDYVRDVVEYAARIWESQLVSPVDIRIQVSWEAFDERGVLASAGPTTLYRDFEGALEPEIWYAVALAESLIGINLNEDDPDINVVINSETNWYTALDGNTPRNRIDMVSVILHELGHGLGFFASTMSPGDSTGVIGLDDLPLIYDVFLENGAGQHLINPLFFESPSVELLDELTGNDLFFDSEAATLLNGGLPQLWAPAEFEEGSSISHLDERLFPPGNDNALMSPQIAFG